MISSSEQFLEFVESAYNISNPNQDALNVLQQLRIQDPKLFLLYSISLLNPNLSKIIVLFGLTQLKSLLEGSKLDTFNKTFLFWNEFNQNYQQDEAVKSALINLLLNPAINSDQNATIYVSIILARIVAFDLMFSRSSQYYFTLVDLLFVDNSELNSKITILNMLSYLFGQKMLNSLTIIVDRANIVASILRILNTYITVPESYENIFNLIENICIRMFNRTIWSNADFITLCINYFDQVTNESTPEIIKSMFSALARFVEANYLSICRNEEMLIHIFEFAGNHLASDNPYSVKHSMKFLRKVAKYENLVPYILVNPPEERIISKFGSTFFPLIVQNLNGLSDADSVIEFLCEEDISIATEASQTLYFFGLVDSNIINEQIDGFKELLNSSDWKLVCAGLMGILAVFTSKCESADECFSYFILPDESNQSILMNFMNSDIIRIQSIITLVIKAAIKYCQHTVLEQQEAVDFVRTLIIEGLNSSKEFLRNSLSLLKSFCKLYHSNQTVVSNKVVELFPPVSELVLNLLVNNADDFNLIQQIRKAYIECIVALPKKILAEKLQVCSAFIQLLTSLPAEAPDHIKASIIEIIGFLIYKNELPQENSFQLWDLFFAYFAATEENDEWVIGDLKNMALFALEILMKSNSNVRNRLGDFPIQLLNSIPHDVSATGFNYAFFFIDAVFKYAGNIYSEHAAMFIESLLDLANVCFDQPVFRYILIALTSVIMSNSSVAINYYDALISIPCRIKEISFDENDKASVRNIRDILCELLKFNSAIISILESSVESKQEFTAEIIKRNEVLFYPTIAIPIDSMNYNMAVGVMEFVRSIIGNMMINPNKYPKHEIFANLNKKSVLSTLLWIKNNFSNDVYLVQLADNTKREITSSY